MSSVNPLIGAQRQEADMQKAKTRHMVKDSAGWAVRSFATRKAADKLAAKIGGRVQSFKPLLPTDATAMTTLVSGDKVVDVQGWSDGTYFGVHVHYGTGVPFKQSDIVKVESKYRSRKQSN